MGHVHTDDIWEEHCGQKEQLTQGKNSWHVPETKEVRSARPEGKEGKERVQKSDGETGSGPMCNTGT